MLVYQRVYNYNNIFPKRRQLPPPRAFRALPIHRLGPLQLRQGGGGADVPEAVLHDGRTLGGTTGENRNRAETWVNWWVKGGKKKMMDLSMMVKLWNFGDFTMSSGYLNQIVSAKSWNKYGIIISKWKRSKPGSIFKPILYLWISCDLTIQWE